MAGCIKKPLKSLDGVTSDANFEKWAQLVMWLDCAGKMIDTSCEYN